MPSFLGNLLLHWNNLSEKTNALIYVANNPHIFTFRFPFIEFTPLCYSFQMNTPVFRFSLFFWFIKSDVF